MAHTFERDQIFEIQTPRHGNRYFVLAKSFTEAERKYWEVMDKRAADYEKKHGDVGTLAWYEVPSSIRRIEQTELL